MTEHVTFTYKCPCCAEADEPGSMTSSKRDPTPIPKSIASASLLAFICVSKFQDSLPLYRLSRIFGRYDISLGRGVMAEWMIKAAALAQPLINHLWDHLLECGNIGCDETTVQVLREPERQAEQKSYMWVTTTMRGPPITLFSYEIGRSAKVAEKILAGFDGTIVCDGLKSYDSFAGKASGEVVLAGCLAYIRRKFVHAERALKKVAPKTVPKTQYPLDLIDSIYDIEAEIKELSPDERRKRRQVESKPLTEELKTWLDEKEAKVLPKSLLAFLTETNMTCRVHEQGSRGAFL